MRVELPSKVEMGDEIGAGNFWGHQHLHTGQGRALTLPFQPPAPPPASTLHQLMPITEDKWNSKYKLW